MLDIGDFPPAVSLLPPRKETEEGRERESDPRLTRKGRNDDDDRERIERGKKEKEEEEEEGAFYFHPPP